MSQTMTLASVVRENARSSPTRAAVVCGLTSLNHSQLAQRIDRLTGVFADLGIGSGDRIVWLGQNCHRWLESLVAAGRLGAVLASLNWDWVWARSARALRAYARAPILLPAPTT